MYIACRILLDSNSLFTLFGVRNISEAQAKAEREALGLNPERGV